MVEGRGLQEYPLFETDFKGDAIHVYRHPFFYVTDSVWAWWEEYKYYQKVQDHTPYYERDPRYLEAVRIYETELSKRTST